MSPPSVLLISYHFYPSNEIGARRPTALARFLVEQGLRVTVVSAFGDQNVAPGSEVLSGITAVQIRRPARTFIGTLVSLKRRLQRARSGRSVRGPSDQEPASAPVPATSLLSRMREYYFRLAYFIDDYKRWGLRARRAAIQAGRRHPPSLVLSSSPPLSVLWVGTLVARRLGVPHIIDLRDPWSDVVADLHPAWVLELILQRWLERWMMHTAAAITSTTVKVIDLLTGRQPALSSKTFVIRNGYDGAVHSTGRDTGGRLSIFFAGNLYLNRDPFPLLDALERLLSRPDVDASRVTLTLMGRRTDQAEKSLTEWLRGKRCAQVVTLAPPQSAEVVAEMTAQSTVLLNLAQRQPMSVPAKTFEHLASGRENLLLCEDDSETALLVDPIPGVTHVDPRNAAALDHVLLDLYDRHVNQGQLRAPAERDVSAFSRDAANRAFWSVLEAVVSTGTRGVVKERPC